MLLVVESLLFIFSPELHAILILLLNSPSNAMGILLFLRSLFSCLKALFLDLHRQQFYLPGPQLSHWACCSHQPPAPSLSPVLAHLIGHFLIADSFFALQLMILFKDHKAFCQQLAFSWKRSNSLMDLPSKWSPYLHIPNEKMSFSYILGDSPSSL